MSEHLQKLIKDLDVLIRYYNENPELFFAGDTAEYLEDYKNILIKNSQNEVNR